MGGKMGFELWAVTGRALVGRGSFQVAIQVFVRLALGAGGGQVEDGDVLLGQSEPLLNRLAVLNFGMRPPKRLLTPGDESSDPGA